MGKTLTEKLIAAHLVSGSMEPGAEVALRIDQTLTQDATGTMAYLEFESMGIDRVKTKRRGPYRPQHFNPALKNADDHRYPDRCRQARHLVPAPATASATRCIWNASACRVRPSSAPTATPPPAAASACWVSCRLAWTWPWPWAVPTTLPCPGSSRSAPTDCRGASLRHHQGHQLGGPAAPLRQGRRGACDGMGVVPASPDYPFGQATIAIWVRNRGLPPPSSPPMK